ncbi:MAG TPA: hypothetical protein VK633_06365, partial [Verrucomicrobiae bacterium]|nr:hypothetical protein [Verrucomicrobiae bacterium]
TLIFASMAGHWKGFRFLPPGGWLWLAYCFASLISIYNAPMPLYTWFAFVKALKMVVVFIAAYNFIRTEKELRFALLCLVGVMCWELIAVINQKYVDHIYQVWGTFEHQNSLCMFTILLGMVLLAVALGPKEKGANFFLFAFIGCAAIVQSSLSRAGLFIFAAGTVGVVAGSLIDRPTRRRLSVLGGLTLVALLGLAMTMDTILARFNDYGNDESKRTRDMLNLSSRMMLNDFPAGIGWNNFAETINPPWTYGEHIDYWQQANGNTVDKKYRKGVVESLWWLLLAETGYQGFATYVLFIALFLFWNVRNAIFFRRSYLGSVSIGLFVGSSMNYAQSFLERVLTQPRNMMLWFILLAMTARIHTWRKAELRRRRFLFEEQVQQTPRKYLEYHEPAAA